MIYKSEIQSKATEWSIAPNTVDKDFVLGHFLNTFYSFGDNIKLFVFKGGTCLRKCYFKDYRFSEDLDFTLTDRSFIIDQQFFEKIAQECELNSGIKFWVRNFEVKQFKDEHKSYKCIINFWGANHEKNTPTPPKE